MKDLFLMAIGLVFINNVVLTKFLGLCPFVGVSKRSKDSLGMGLAVIFVVFVSSIITYAIYHLILKPLDITYMQLITFILVIASFVQFTEMFIKKNSPTLYKSLGVYLPLITTNCIVLAVANQNISQGYSFVEMLVHSVSVPLGFAIMLYIFALIRERLDSADTPNAFKGNPIAIITLAIMALAMAGLAGIA
ncbi:MAG: RnfABCDGE type electron transport complex subunit A [Erysipelotrichaceae bacterium]|nr:RnfABCDGE type electron transport complex subunit A [Erysipelotrichaceae bacterium]